MLGTKTLNTVKIMVGIFLACIAMGAIFLTRNNTFPRQASYSLFRYLTGQEVNFKTAGWREVQTRHYTIKYHPVDEAYAELVGSTAEEAYTEVTGVFGREPAQKTTTIVVYPDSSSLAQSFGWDKDEKALGVYLGGAIRILSPREWAQGEDMEVKFMKEGPMVHELAHLMVDDMTRGNYNRWWTEGMAQYVEKKTTGFEFADPSANNHDIELYPLITLEKNFDKLDQQVAYWESLQVVEFIVDQYGEDKLFSILELLRQGNSMAQAINKTLGLDYQAFENTFIQNIN